MSEHGEFGAGDDRDHRPPKRTPDDAFENPSAKKLSAAIDEAQKHHPADDEEVTLWSGNYSAKNMVGTWVVIAMVSFLALVMMVFFSALRTSGLAWMVFLALLVLGWLGVLALMFYRKWSYFYEVTNQRIKHRDGIFIRTTNRIELIDIDDVVFKQGPIQSLMRVGNIKVNSSDASHPELLMQGIANVQEVADKIDDARRIERRRRGLHIEAI